MKKDVYCIIADGHVRHVAKKEDLDEVLQAWRGMYRDAEAVPMEEAVGTSGPVIDQIRELFEKMEYPYEIYMQGRKVCIEIEQGDWRHDHRNADDIMETAFGFILEDETVINEDEDESDWYGSVHTYAPRR